jgi:hypothetical protein
MNVPTGVVKQQRQINAAVRAVRRELSPWVRHIRYEIAQDWSGQWAIFFRVLLTDEASNEHNLREVATRVVSRMSEKLDLPSLGLFPYFDFRSESEQAKLNEPAWV